MSQKIPWPYLKFPDFSRFTKFPDNSRSSRFVGTLDKCSKILTALPARCDWPKPVTWPLGHAPTPANHRSVGGCDLSGDWLACGAWPRGHVTAPSDMCHVCTFAVPELAGCLLAATFDPSRPALETVLAEFRSVAVPVDRHEVDGVLVGRAGTENSRPEESEVELCLKERDGLLIVTTAAEQSAQLGKQIWHIEQRAIQHFNESSM